MSDQITIPSVTTDVDGKPLPEVVSTILANPSDSVPPDKLLELMYIWKKNVEDAIAVHQAKKDAEYAVYKRQKDLYDSWLSTRSKSMKKIDILINNRKKVLIDVNKEIAKMVEAINNPPPADAQQ